MKKTAIRTPKKLLEIANALFATSAVYASMRILDEAEKFAAEQGKKILYVTSFSTNSVAGRLKPGAGVSVPERRKPGFSYIPQFSNFMRKKGVPWVDLLSAHTGDYSTAKLSIAHYLQKYYVEPHDHSSHYTPLGNFFTALAMKNKLVELLEPKPISYRHTPALAQWDDCVAI